MCEIRVAVRYHARMKPCLFAGGRMRACHARWGDARWERAERMRSWERLAGGRSGQRAPRESLEFEGMRDRSSGGMRGRSEVRAAPPARVAASENARSVRSYDKAQSCQLSEVPVCAVERKRAVRPWVPGPAAARGRRGARSILICINLASFKPALIIW